MTMKMMKRSGHRLAEFGLLVLVGLAILPIVGIDARASALPWYYGGDDGNVIYVAVGESIQDAIDAAGEGWTVELAPGEHLLPGIYGDLSIYGKSITLLGSLSGDGAPASRIQGTYGALPFNGLLYTNQSPTPTIENLVVASSGPGGAYGTAVNFNDGSPTIRNCVIADNNGDGSIYSNSSAVLFGGGSQGGELRIFDTVIRDNGTIGLRVNGYGTRSWTTA